MEQAKQIFKIFNYSKQQEWFGQGFTNNPLYQILAGDFHSNLYSKILKVFDNNYHSDQSQISNKITNTEFILFNNTINELYGSYKPEYANIPISTKLRKSGFPLPVSAKLTFEVELSTQNNNIPSNDAMKDLPTIKIGEPSTGNNINKSNINKNISTNVSKPSSNRKPLKKNIILPGLSKGEQQKYNEIQKKYNETGSLSPKSKKVLKQLKNKTEIAPT